MASRKDYIATARVISKIKNPRDRARTMIHFERIYKEDNPRFDTERFRKACGYAKTLRRAMKTYKTHAWYDTESILGMGKGKELL